MLLLLLLHVQLAHALLLHHRIHTSNAPHSAWHTRAAVDLTASAIVERDPEWTSALLRPFDPNAVYQLALQRDYDVGPDDWDVAFVPACFLDTAQTEQITLLSDGNSPFAIHYRLDPVSHSGICSSSIARSTPSILNTTLVVVGLRSPPTPELRVPPPLTPQGQPAVPIPEKTFIQKYWPYIILFLGLMLFTGGAEEPQPGAARGE